MGSFLASKRLYVVTGVFEGETRIPRPEKLEQVYNKLCRLAKRLAPGTPITLGNVEKKTVSW